MFKEKLLIQQVLSRKRLDKKIEKMQITPKQNGVALDIILFFSKTFVLLFFGAIILFPFFYMISTSLMSNDEVRDVTQAHLIPKNGAHWENFRLAFIEGYWKALLLTLIVTVLSIILKLILTITMGYAFSYKKWWGKKAIWYFLLAILMVPEIALVVGQYKMTVALHMQVGNQTLIAMVLPFIAHIFSAFMFRNAFEAIPNRTKEAALTDGASEFTYFWKIALPMIQPTTWTVIILTAFASWNSYMWPQLLAFGSTDPKHVLGTWLFTTGKEVDDLGQAHGLLVNVRLAASIIVALPMLITYFLFRKRIMMAISKQGAAIKG